jgi:peptidoglycan hydrolase-like protein with peptidoglycan-binding domain
MPERRIRTLAVTSITIVAAALVTLSTTAASAATTAASAPGHVTAPRAAAAAGCVTDTFTTRYVNTYEQCVRDEQVLLNDLHYGLVDGMERAPLLTVDGYYGPHTYSVVRFFQGQIGFTPNGITDPKTWKGLCVIAYKTNFTGVYWHDAGCASVV